MKNEEAQAVTVQPRRRKAPVITPMEMIKIAVEGGADIDQLQKLMDLQERWEANDARKAYVVAKAGFRAQAPAIPKNQQVGFKSKRGGDDTSYYHATLDVVADTLSPLLSAHGLSYSWETDQKEDGTIRVTCVMTHILGHSERVTLQGKPDNTGNKNPIQAVGSTVTYLQRYTLLSSTGMATGGQDTDAIIEGAAEFVSEEQKTEIIELSRKVGADTGRFLAFMGVASIDKLPAKRFDDAIIALNKKRKAKE